MNNEVLWKASRRLTRQLGMSVTYKELCNALCLECSPQHLMQMMHGDFEPTPEVMSAALRMLRMPDGIVYCEECGSYPADLPSKLCPGCEAYKEHQS